MQLTTMILGELSLSCVAEPREALLVQQGVAENPVNCLVEQDDSRVLLCKDEGKMMLLADVLNIILPVVASCPHTTPAWLGTDIL